jgi:hypothetical protein
MGNSSVVTSILTEYVSSAREKSIIVISAVLAGGGKVIDNGNGNEISIPAILIWRKDKIAKVVAAIDGEVFCLSELFVSKSTGSVHLSSSSCGVAMDCTKGIKEGIEQFNRESAADTFGDGWGQVELLYEF